MGNFLIAESQLRDTLPTGKGRGDRLGIVFAQGGTNKRRPREAQLRSGGVKIYTNIILDRLRVCQWSYNSRSGPHARTSYQSRNEISWEGYNNNRSQSDCCLPKPVLVSPSSALNDEGMGLTVHRKFHSNGSCDLRCCPQINRWCQPHVGAG